MTRRQNSARVLKASSAKANSKLQQAVDGVLSGQQRGLPSEIVPLLQQLLKSNRNLEERVRALEQQQSKFCCPLCPISFNREDRLRHHMRTEDDEHRGFLRENHPTTCAICGKDCKNWYSLDRHMSAFHKDATSAGNKHSQPVDGHRARPASAGPQANGSADLLASSETDNLPTAGATDSARENDMIELHNLTGGDQPAVYDSGIPTRSEDSGTSDDHGGRSASTGLQADGGAGLVPPPENISLLTGRPPGTPRENEEANGRDLDMPL
ncbi:MAG: hypothetical protein M1815_000076 [Lichina confinis]|nr:MAG: hypothetical protein M1815_000076 [Lichina confinis]